MVQAAHPSNPGHSGAPQLEQVLANMELRVLQASYADERARIYNLAGDLCFDGGARERALSYYGRAIDVLVEAEQFEGAVGVCRKIVRLTPEVVRARCTLAWMALGGGLIEEASQRISDYARAAVTAGQEEAAARHLRLMTDIAASQAVLESLAEALMELGDAVGADRAYGAALDAEGRAKADQDAGARWAAVLRMLNGKPVPSADFASPPTDAVDLTIDTDGLPRSRLINRRRYRRT